MYMSREDKKEYANELIDGLIDSLEKRKSHLKREIAVINKHIDWLKQPGRFMGTREVDYEVPEGKEEFFITDGVYAEICGSYDDIVENSLNLYGKDIDKVKNDTSWAYTVYSEIYHNRYDKYYEPLAIIE